MSNNSRFFQNRACEYFPCHAGAGDDFNCLFCFCPLYALGSDCGGDYTYTDNGIKDCSGCMFPHRRDNYDPMMQKIADIIDMTKR